MLDVVDPSAALPFCGGETVGVVIRVLDTVEVLLLSIIVVG